MKHSSSKNKKNVNNIMKNNDKKKCNHRNIENT